MTLPKITESIIRAGATPQSFQRGKEYYQDRAISNITRQGNVLAGDCEGISAPYYRVSVTLDEAGIREVTYACPYEYDGYYKHVVALLLTHLHQPKRFAVRQEPAELVADLTHDDLVKGEALQLVRHHRRIKPELARAPGARWRSRGAG